MNEYKQLHAGSQHKPKTRSEMFSPPRAHQQPSAKEEGPEDITNPQFPIAVPNQSQPAPPQPVLGRGNRRAAGVQGPPGRAGSQGPPGTLPPRRPGRGGMRPGGRVAEQPREDRSVHTIQSVLDALNNRKPKVERVNVPIPIPMYPGGTSDQPIEKKPAVVVKQTVKQVVNEPKKRKAPSKLSGLKKQYNQVKKTVVKELRSAKKSSLTDQLAQANELPKSKRAAAKKKIRAALTSRLKKLLQIAKPAKHFTDGDELRKAIRVVKRLKW